jgi:hypothetical protein
MAPDGAARDRLVRRIILIALACLVVAVAGMLALGLALVRS